MTNEKSPSNLKQVAVLLVAALTGTIGLISFPGFGLLGLVAWADYSDRGCSEIWGQQCDDAFYTMTYSSLISVLGLIFIILAGWTAMRLFRRLENAPL